MFLVSLFDNDFFIICASLLINAVGLTELTKNCQL